MDYIKKFDIELEKDYYYAGESIHGWVVVDATENIKVRGVRVILRGKAHVEWKVTRGGERRMVREDQYFIDDKTIIWGKDKHGDGPISIMPRGEHRYPFDFALPETSLPCSFESKYGTVRYYLKVTIDIPYASPPQGIKYFTIVGPHLDCMEDRYLTPVSYKEEYRRCCWCCVEGPVQLEATLDRSAYCCGENIKLKCSIQNGSDDKCWVVCRLLQHVQFRVNKGVLGITKDVEHKVWEVQGPTLEPHSSQSFNDLQRHLRVPTMPPSHTDICKVIEIYYIVQVCIKVETASEFLHMNFPVAIATLPFRIPTSKEPKLHYEAASNVVEGGMYISPEFQLGQVYDGNAEIDEETVLFRPVYACVKPEARNSSANCAQPMPSTSRDDTHSKALASSTTTDAQINPNNKHITDAYNRMDVENISQAIEEDTSI